jgi:hypothetical protein
MTFDEFREKSKNSIRPITFYAQHYPPSCNNYWLGGTGFFLKYGDIDIFITARHVFEKSETLSLFENIQQKIESFFIIKSIEQCNLENPDTRVPVKQIYMHSIPSNDMVTDITGLSNYDTNDIAVIELFSNQNSNIFRLPTSGYTSVHEINDTEKAHIGDTLLVFGHPNEENYFVYPDDEHDFSLSCKRVHLLGTCREVNDGIGIIDIIEDNELTEYRGFSGSPVFKINTELGTYKLTGITIRGTSKSKKVYFITINYFYLYLMRLDTKIMFLGADASEIKIKNIIMQLNGFGILNIEIVDKMLRIELFNGNYISINPMHEYIIQALYIMLKYPELAIEKNIYLIQELIIFTYFDQEILKILSAKDITIELLQEIQEVLLDDDFRNNIKKYLDDDTIYNRLLSV